MESPDKSAPGPWPADPNRAQLSENRRVPSNVSSVALNQEGVRLQSGAEPLPPHGVPYEQMTDAEVMLRVRVGDNAAFDHLVAKFRRAMVHFMYRMARNQATAEE